MWCAGEQGINQRGSPLRRAALIFCQRFVRVFVSDQTDSYNQLLLGSCAAVHSLPANC
jgi:hypothetical protein